MSGHRQAAAALHGLLEEDRGLIIAQLPPSDQDTLRNYLAELDALGFDSTGLDLGIAPAPAAPDLATASAATMYRLLEAEPASLVAQVLAARQWRWADGMLALCPQARREAIRAVPLRQAPARTRFVLEALAARLAEDAAAAGEANGRKASASRLPSFLRRVAAWRR
ncbi:hypothetical protein [Duganella radicis]|uniref:Uncharacterized protein n=1 Tax=Duganella radicis TaxID=551988 RepID=A0A6L6PQR9_9BURK|nr:hypothetical protein [Duganella radicis]MTV41456.1 hypothetical protein [Duganella radicis]